MSFVRLIPVLTLKDGRMIKTIQFDQYRDVGHPRTMGKVYDSQDVDELVFLDITATQENRAPDYESIQMFAEECAMPLTIGGGVKSRDIIRELLNIGADKVVINSEAVRRPEFITEAANSFGSQCIVVSIDAKRYSGSGYEVLIDGGYERTGLEVVEWAKEVERRGAGEIMITAIDREGTMEGYDLDLIRSVQDAVSIPVIANGGAGLLVDLLDLIKETDATAVACSSLFLFTDNKPIKVKSFLQTGRVPVRPI
ncbi:MAG: imidazole glycerol phosphate synthase cyclase subunit [Marivibrio sp.]|uniref:imidazole glycerol phosphate synthase subunit HisF n=1 Tax=Marivibrio sp. TaxID=2039719 RepID=UPI0032EBEB76